MVGAGDSRRRGRSSTATRGLEASDSGVFGAYGAGVGHMGISALGGISPNKPASKSSRACPSSALVFITNGPYVSTCSPIGWPPARAVPGRGCASVGDRGRERIRSFHSRPAQRRSVLRWRMLATNVAQSISRPCDGSTTPLRAGEEQSGAVLSGTPARFTPCRPTRHQPDRQRRVA